MFKTLDLTACMHACTLARTAAVSERYEINIHRDRLYNASGKRETFSSLCQMSRLCYKTFSSLCLMSRLCNNVRPSTPPPQHIHLTHTHTNTGKLTLHECNICGEWQYYPGVILLQLLLFVLFCGLQDSVNDQNFGKVTHHTSFRLVTWFLLLLTATRKHFAKLGDGGNVFRKKFKPKAK